MAAASRRSRSTGSSDRHSGNWGRWRRAIDEACNENCPSSGCLIGTDPVDGSRWLRVGAPGPLNATARGGRARDHRPSPPDRGRGTASGRATACRPGSDRLSRACWPCLVDRMIADQWARSCWPRAGFSCFSPSPFAARCSPGSRWCRCPSPIFVVSRCARLDRRPGRHGHGDDRGGVDGACSVDGWVALCGRLSPPAWLPASAPLHAALKTAHRTAGLRQRLLHARALVVGFLSHHDERLRSPPCRV